METTIHREATESHTLLSLHGRSDDALEAVFRASPAPTTIEPLDGHPVGLGLKIGRGLDFLRRGPLGFVGRRVEADSLGPDFTWNGKSFHAHAKTTGRGINRLRLWGVQAGFPFEVKIAPSLIDGKPCIALDFTVDENPWWEKPTYDELREIAPRVYMGPSMYKTKQGVRILAWFGVDANRQVERPLGY